MTKSKRKEMEFIRWLDDRMPGPVESCSGALRKAVDRYLKGDLILVTVHSRMGDHSQVELRARPKIVVDGDSKTH